MKVSDIGGEFELIKRINKKTKLFSKDVIVGIGDDAAVLKYSKGKYLLFTTDMLVEEDHFSLDYCSAEQVGMKAMEVNVSDIAAMGGVPKHALISLALPKNIEAGFVDGLYNGLNKAGEKYQVNVIGGDITHSKQIVINVSMAGFVEKKNLCLRSDAKAGDLICLSGDVGKSTAGLELLKKKKQGKSIKPHIEPKARLGFARKIAPYVNALEDVSDGLAQEARNICDASKKGAVIFKEKIPISKNTIDDAKKVKKDAYDFALYGGEDFELVFTVNKKNFKLLKSSKNSKNFLGHKKSQSDFFVNKKIKFYVVGEVLPKNKGLYLLDNGRKIKLKKGYDHFK